MGCSSCGWHCETGGCMAEPDSEGICQSLREELMQAEMDWLDWVEELITQAEIAGIELAQNRQRAYMPLWQAGKSVEEVLQEMQE